ncbi:MAG: Aspartate-semialdehyde dehydrogenase 2, partial [Chlamydiae bacterium]|nr:Aspartate-semialdehyde dehydrogenase 2 [Chlamydiota bacterium]
MNKIRVGILGATGMVGQKFVELLSSHPWFEIVALAASDRSVGKLYGDVVKWSMPLPLPQEIAQLPIIPCEPKEFPCSMVFSGLPSSIAGEVEENFARGGCMVISNAKNHRMDPDVPLLIPEVNSEHLKLIKSQRFGKGAIVTNPNCSVIGIAMGLKPLLDQWGIEAVNVVTLQALSGAGFPGIPSRDIVDNVIPHIPGEEEKIETEPLKILGELQKKTITPHSMSLSAQCTRVAVPDGHLACISVKLNEKAKKSAIIDAWRKFLGEPQKLQLPSAPKHPIIYLEDESHPQPKLHRLLENGMAISVGRLQECPLLDWKFIILSHN